MSIQLRKLKAMVLGQTSDVDAATATLRDAAVPVSTDDCRTCADPCDLGHEEFPDRFDTDRETQLLGTMKPFRRQVVISTGKTDWAHDVTSVSGSLAHYLDSHPPSTAPKHANGDAVSIVAGVCSLTQSDKVTILNGSHRSVADDSAHETVLVFPDFKVVRAVEKSKEGAAELWRHAVDPGVGRAGAKDESELRSWVLPYSCVILLCSHKKRDNRCAISAPKLAHGFTTALERSGFDVHTQLEDPADHGAPLEDLTGTDSEREDAVLEQLKSHSWEHADEKRALILNISHVGGHKFAGNVIIYTPQNVGVWYGRVTPHHCDAIVKETILGGKIFPALLRGGINIARPGRASLNDW